MVSSGPAPDARACLRAVAGGDLAAASRTLQPLFTRTTKGELDLPPVDISLRLLELPPLHAEIYDALVGQFSARAVGTRGRLPGARPDHRLHAHGRDQPGAADRRHDAGTNRWPTRCRRFSVPEGSSLYELMQDLPAYEMSPKYTEVLAIVRENAAQGRKTLVWSTFIRSLTTLQRLLGQFSPAMVHGGTSDREEQIQRFRADPDCMVLLSNPATLGEGISLHHECHDAIYVDRDFAAGRFLQSLDRIHRLGLEPDVETRITVLASEGTIDEVVAARLATKLDFMGTILDDPAVQQLADLDEEPAVGGGLDRSDLQALMGHLHAPSPEPVLVAAKRWLELLPASGGIPRAQALLTTHAEYSDLTPTQYATALTLASRSRPSRGQGFPVPAASRLFGAIFEKAPPPLGSRRRPARPLARRASVRHRFGGRSARPRSGRDIRATRRQLGKGRHCST